MSDHSVGTEPRLKELIYEVEENSESKQVKLQQSSRSTSELLIADDVSPLSKPYIYFILSKVHVKPLYRMVFPSRFYPDLPSTTGPSITVPATIICHGKTWETTFFADSKVKRLDSPSWKSFVIDNNLKYGDAVFWELKESSNEKVKFKVQIVRGDFPAELEATANGETMNSPIIIE